MTIAERVPARGEVIAVPGDFEVEVLDADSRRIKRLRLLHGAARLGEATGPASLPPHPGSEAGLRHDLGATGA